MLKNKKKSRSFDQSQKGSNSKDEQSMLMMIIITFNNIYNNLFFWVAIRPEYTVKS